VRRQFFEFFNKNQQEQQQDCAHRCSKIKVSTTVRTKRHLNEKEVSKEASAESRLEGAGIDE